MPQVTAADEVNGPRRRYAMPRSTTTGRMIQIRLAVGRLGNVKKVEGDTSHPEAFFVSAHNSNPAVLDPQVQAAICQVMDDNGYTVG